VQDLAVSRHGSIGLSDRQLEQHQPVRTRDVHAGDQDLAAVDVARGLTCLAARACRAPGLHLGKGRKIAQEQVRINLIDEAVLGTSPDYA
jgi:hypothetical protein